MPDNLPINDKGFNPSGAITCETTVLHRSKCIAIMESEISNEGRLIAKATGTFYVMRRGAPE